MPFNGSGTYNLSDTIANGTDGDANEVQAILDDIADGITNAVAKDGQSTMTGPLKASNGTVSAPSYTWGSDTNTGFYRISADTIGLAVNGTLLVTFDVNGITLASGDVLGTGIFKTAGIEDNAVTLAKLATQADATVLANVSGGAAVPSAVTYTNLFNDAFGSTQGTLIYRGASDWSALATGTADYVLTTQGAGADPVWKSAGSISLPSQTSNASKVLKTDGTNASWGDPSSARGQLNGLTTTPAVGAGAINIASCSVPSTGVVRVTFTTPLANVAYQIFPSVNGAANGLIWFIDAKLVGSCDIHFYNTSGSSVTPISIDVLILGGY